MRLPVLAMRDLPLNDLTTVHLNDLKMGCLMDESLKISLFLILMEWYGMYDYSMWFSRL